MLTLSHLTFDDKNSRHPSLGIRVINRIKRNVSPATDDHLLSVAGRDGVYDLGSTRKPLEIPVRLAIEGDRVERRAYAREVAKWLSPRDVRPLIFSDEPHHRYMARVIGEISLSEVAIWGYCDILFLVPGAYSEASAITSYSAFPAQNDGTIEVLGTVTATAKEATNTLKITRQDNSEFVLLNQSLQINDVVVFDTLRRLVTVNGVDARPDLDISSSYFAFPVGEFTLTATPSSTELAVEFREGYL